MRPSYEMVWLTAYTTALRNPSNNSQVAVAYADHALQEFKYRFPESNGNG